MFETKTFIYKTISIVTRDIYNLATKNGNTVQTLLKKQFNNYNGTGTKIIISSSGEYFSFNHLISNQYYYLCPISTR